MVEGLLRYPVVIATLVVGLVGGVLELSGQPTAARWGISAFAVVVALMQARGMVDDLRSGSYGIDILAVTAIGSTVAVGEYWAALVVCLMLSGGEALEDHAANRARRELTGLLERHLGQWQAPEDPLPALDRHAVGLPEGQMGNSEVGHTNLGAGRVVMQDLVRIIAAIESGYRIGRLLVLREVMGQEKIGVYVVIDITRFLNPDEVEKSDEPKTEARKGRKR